MMLSRSAPRLGLYRVLRIESVSTTRNRPKDEAEHSTRSAVLKTKEAELKVLNQRIVKNSKKLSYRYGLPVNIGMPGTDMVRHDTGLLNRESWDNDGKVWAHVRDSRVEMDPEIEILTQLRNYHAGTNHPFSFPLVKVYNENVVCYGDRHDVYNYSWSSLHKQHSKSHPRVHIRCKAGQVSTCKYCLRQFIFTDRDGNIVPLTEDRPAHYKRSHIFNLLDDPSRLSKAQQEDLKHKRGEWSDPHETANSSEMYTFENMRRRREASPFGEGPEHQPANYTRRVAHAVDAAMSFVTLPKRASDAPMKQFVD